MNREGRKMFKEERSRSTFSWEDLGDIALGRVNLGPSVPVQVYRLLQYTLRDVLIARFGVAITNEIFVQAGKLAGSHFCTNLLDGNLAFPEFIAALQQALKERCIGILRVEKADLQEMEFTLTVAEDLDCSGLPFSDEVVCNYDEGFMAGILEAYTGEPFEAREIDCWASGDRVCRFNVRRAGEKIP
jgi:predicted hydrocarbon binding protein